MRVKAPATVDFVIRREMVKTQLPCAEAAVVREEETAATSKQKSRIGFLPIESIFRAITEIRNCHKGSYITITTYQYRRGSQQIRPTQYSRRCHRGKDPAPGRQS